MKIRLLTGIAALMAICSCKRYDPEPEFRPIILERLRDVARIKTGSYFVYQDSLSGRLDSFVVSDVDSGAYREYTDNTMNESMSYRMTDAAEPARTIDVTARRSTIRGRISIVSGYEGLFMAFPFTINTSYDFYGGSGICLNQNASISVLGKSYTDVYEMSSVNPNTNLAIHSWFSQNDGLLKFSLEHDSTTQTFLLKRSRIIR